MEVTVRWVDKVPDGEEEALDGQVELMVKAALEEEVLLVLVVLAVAAAVAVMLAAAAAVEVMFLVLAEVHLVLMPHQIIQLQSFLTSVMEKLSSPHYATSH